MATTQNKRIFTFCIALTWFRILTPLSAQQADSVIYQQIIKQHKKEIHTALKNSLLPGYQQIKNKNYFTAPFYYASFALLGTLAYNHHNEYLSKRNSYYQYYSDRAPFSYYTIKREHNNYPFNSLAKTNYSLKITANSELTLLMEDMQKHRRIRNFCITGIALTYMINLAEGIAPVSKSYHSPYKAALYSALIPGLGQIYNEEYWKLPLVFAGFGIFAFFINYNNEVYKSMLEAYLIRNRKDPYEMKYSGNNYVNSRVSDQALLNQKGIWKRYRDYCVLGTIAFYGLNIIDAMVFSYLKDYDVSDNLSIQLKPNININSFSSADAGLKLTINF